MVRMAETLGLVGDHKEKVRQAEGSPGAHRGGGRCWGGVGTGACPLLGAGMVDAADKANCFFLGFIQSP